MRSLALTYVTGMTPRPEYTAVCFNLCPGVGEYFVFPALATTSAGFAWSLGRADNHVFHHGAESQNYGFTQAIDDNVAMFTPCGTSEMVNVSILPEVAPLFFGRPGLAGYRLGPPIGAGWATAFVTTSGPSQSSQAVHAKARI